MRRRFTLLPSTFDIGGRHTVRGRKEKRFALSRQYGPFQHIVNKQLYFLSYTKIHRMEKRNAVKKPRPLKRPESSWTFRCPSGAFHLEFKEGKKIPFILQQMI